MPPSAVSPLSPLLSAPVLRTTSTTTEEPKSNYVWSLTEAVEVERRLGTGTIDYSEWIITVYYGTGVSSYDCRRVTASIQIQYPTIGPEVPIN